MKANVFKIFIVIAMVSLELYALPVTSSMDNSAVLWLAVVLMSVIGVFALYVSSGQVEAISEKYDSAQKYSEGVKLKHNIALSVLNERLKNSTIGIQRHRELIEELAAENPDLQILQNEAKKIKRDESILQEAIRDLEHFKSIQDGKLEFEHERIEIDELLSHIDRITLPNLVVKNNKLNYEIDLLAPIDIAGDFKKMEKIISTMVVEAANDMYNGKIELTVSQDEESGRVIFVIVSDEMPDMSDFGNIIDEDDLDGSQYSIRILKNYIARELLYLMDGEIIIKEQDDIKSVSLLFPNNL